MSFTPDLKRFKMDCLDDDVVGLLSRRAYDVAASSSCHGNGSLKVELNGERVPVKSFAQYVKLHDGLEPPAAFEKLDDNWTVGVAPSDGTFYTVILRQQYMHLQRRAARRRRGQKVCDF